MGFKGIIVLNWRRVAGRVASLVIVAGSVLNASSSIPSTSLDITGITGASSWRICGPFKLSEADQSALTVAGVERAFAEDYLAKLGGGEAPLRLRLPTTRRRADFGEKGLWAEVACM